MNLQPGLTISTLTSLTLMTQAYASGTLQMPDVSEQLASPAACLARLQAAYECQTKEVAPKAISADGASREVNFTSTTNGVVEAADGTAQYVGRVWYHHGKKTEDGTQREVSHSWQEIKMSCKGAVLTSGGSEGYTLSTFEPL
jgi:hypothetical protein